MRTLKTLALLLICCLAFTAVSDNTSAQDTTQTYPFSNHIDEILKSMPKEKSELYWDMTKELSLRCAALLEIALRLDEASDDYQIDPAAETWLTPLAITAYSANAHVNGVYSSEMNANQVQSWFDAAVKDPKKRYEKWINTNRTTIEDFQEFSSPIGRDMLICGAVSKTFAEQHQKNRKINNTE
jgi:hypothetical protein